MIDKPRHEAIANTLTQLARAGGSAATREDKNLIPNTRRRPGDIFIRNYCGQQDTAVDVAVVSPFVSRDAIETRNKDKRRKSEEECRAQNITFKPFIMDTLGIFDDECEPLIRKLGAGIALRRHTDKVSCIYEIRQLLQISLLKAVAAEVEVRKPEDPFGLFTRCR